MTKQKSKHSYQAVRGVGPSGDWCPRFEPGDTIPEGLFGKDIIQHLLEDGVIEVAEEASDGDGQD